METMSLMEYKRIREINRKEALDECKKANALIYKGNKILVNVEKANKYLEDEIILELGFIG